MRDLAIDIDIDADGLVHVTETYEWDFGDREGLGLRRELAQRFSWPEDPELMRVYEYEDMWIASPSGAPAEGWIAGDGAYLVLDLGAPDGSDDTRTGVQTYELSYTVRGALNAIRDDDDVPDQDEFFWNVTGAEWNNLIEQVTTTVTGPEGITDVRCWEGTDGNDQPCQSQVDGATATFTSGPLEPGEEQTVAVAFGPGTFADTDPILAERTGEVVGLTATQQRIDRFTGPIMSLWEHHAGIVLLGVLLLYAALAVRRRRQGRDQQFVGRPPGTLPPEPDRGLHPVEPVRREPVVAVRFTPPEGLRPAEARWLWRKQLGSNAVAATLVDLAVRGFLTIQSADTDSRGRPRGWILSRTDAQQERAAQLLAYERVLVERIFGDRHRIALNALRSSGGMRTAVKQFETTLAEHIDGEGLFTRPVPAWGRTTGKRRPWWTTAMIVLLLAVFAGGGLEWLPPSAIELGFLAIFILAGWWVVDRLTRKSGLGRSGTGRALYDQMRGFHQYLATAEAHQIRFEESTDVFSRYLPYAIVFEETDRWARIFADLARDGRAPDMTTWYAGAPTAGALAVGTVTLGSALSSFTAAASSAFSPPRTSGSSGSSGFSGGSSGGSSGGGSAGGGGGGGGGGGW